MNKKSTFIIGMAAVGLATAGFLAGCGEAKLYKVTFFTDGGTAIEPIQVEWGKVPTMPENPAKEGYTFTGWYKDQATTNKYVVKEIESDTILYAGWSVNAYTISFDIGYEGQAPSPITGNYGTTFTPEQVTRPYFTFGGWYYDSAFTKQYKSTDTIPGQNITLYANWNANYYTIYFNKNNENAKGEMPEFINISQTSEDNKLACCAYSCDTMDFIGWSLTPDGEVVYADQAVVTNIEVTKDITLYAQWKTKQNSVSFLSVDNVNNTDYMIPYGDSQVLDYGSHFNVPANNPQLTGYSFNGWGKMVKTNDTVADPAKTYYEFSNSSYILHSFLDNENIQGLGYYEVSVIQQMENEKVGVDNTYYASFSRNAHTISIYSSLDLDGEPVATLTGYYKQVLTLPEKPAVVGYNASTFATDRDLVNRYTASTFEINNSDVNLYIVYLAKQHTLTYSIEGSTPVSSLLKYADPLSLPTPSKKGYEFIGWNTVADGSGVYYGPTSTMPDDDLSLFAVFQVKTYTASFYVDGVKYCEDKVFTYHELITLPDAPSKEGYTFGGWFDENDAEYSVNTVMDDIDSSTLRLDARFIVRKHNLSFNETTIPTVENIPFGSELKTYKPTDPTKTGYTFAGWKDSKGNAFDFETATMGDADIVLTPEWVANEAKVKIVYQGTKLGDKSTYVSIAEDETVDSYTDAQYELTSPKSIEGFTFASANKISRVAYDNTSVITALYTRNTVTVSVIDDEGDIETYEETFEYGASFSKIPDKLIKEGKKISFKVDGVDCDDLTKYVIKGGEQIKACYTALPFGIQFFGNGGLIDGQQSTSQEFNFGDNVVFPTVTRTGYTLKGWAFKSDETESFIDVNTYTMPAEAKTVYAIWEANKYDVRIVDELTGVDKTISAEYGSTITIDVLAKDGYTFNGFKNSNGEQLSPTATTYTVPLDGDTLTAQWTEHTATVKFVANGGTGSMDDQVMKTSDSSFELNAVEFSKIGYSFAGWALKSDATVAKYADGADMSSVFDFADEEETLTLYALWTIDDYTLTIDPDNGGEVIVGTYHYGDTLISPASPIKDGYAFAGWYTTGANPERFYFDTMPAGNVTVKAKWVSSTYQVRFNSDGGEYFKPVDIQNNEYVSSVVSTLPTPDKLGYKFDGWYLLNGKETGVWGDKVTDADLATIKVENGDVTFYAKWIENNHTATFYVPTNTGHDVYSKLDDVKYGDVIEVPENPTQGSDTFLGWYEYNSKTGAIGALRDFTADPLMKDEDLEFIAKFESTEYIIRFFSDELDENGQPKLIFQISSKTADPTFMAYVQKLATDIGGYQYIYDAIQNVVQKQVGAGGNMHEFVSLLTYAGTQGLVTPETMRIVALVGQGVSEINAYNTVTLALGAPADSAYYGNVIELGNAFTAYQAHAEEGNMEEVAKDLQKINDLVTNSIGPAAYAHPDVGFYTTLATYVQELAGGDMTHMEEFVAMVTYANVYQEADNTLAFENEFISYLNSSFSYGDHAQYFNYIAANGAGKIEDTAATTSAYLTEAAATYQVLENNAYNPVSSDPNKIFDGWSTSVNSGYINNTATYVEKISSTNNIQTYSSSNSTASFTWDAVNNAYGYRVKVTVNGVERDTVVVRENEYKVENLRKGDVVEIEVTVLLKDAADNYKAASKEYVVDSILDGHQIKIPSVSLDSDPVSTSYIHTTENDIGKVSKFGDYYYLSEDDAGNQTYIFFTNTTYTFGGRTLAIVEKGAGVDDITKLESGDAIVTKGQVGAFRFSVNGDVKDAIVKAIPDSIASGSNLEKRENVTLTNETTNSTAYGSHDFLGEVKSTYKVGAASVGKVTGSHYSFVGADSQTYFNGFKFDVDTLATSGSKMKMDRNYKFEKMNGSGVYEEVTNPDRLFVYDAENDVFYFKASSTGAVDVKDNLGKYRAIITPKADVKQGDDYKYINTDVPNIIKETASKMSRLNKVVEFELVDGVNVYTSRELREATLDYSTSVINIQCNIEAEYAANSVMYMPWVMSFDKTVTNGLRNSLVGDLETGDVDIVQNSAKMTKEDGFGPKIWVKDNSNTPVFRDVNGQGYSYDKANGEYAIETCKWVQNFDNGLFKTVGKDRQHITSCPEALTYDIAGSQCYPRVGTNCVPLEINGNYFSIDGSKIPFTRSNSKNTAGSEIATYEIQSLHTSIFENSSNAPVTYNDMTIICNTSNNSAALDEKTQNVAEIMRMTSGGMSGIRSARSAYKDGVTNTNVVLNSVNIYNSLIAIYADCDADINYVHVKNTWANGVYGWSDYGHSVNLDHTVIEACGGCAVHVDDMEYGITHVGHISNPSVQVNHSNCDIQNFVSGDEQWFKGYSMEVVALGLKSTINSQLAAANKTILQIKKNPVTGLTGEYMNWVFFCKTESIDNQGGKDASDIMADLAFENDYYYNDAFGIYVKMADATTPYIDENGNLKTLSIVDAATQAPINCGLTPTFPRGGGANYLLIYADVNASVLVGQPMTMSITKQFLYFRQSQDPFGWIQGMVEVFDK